MNSEKFLASVQNKVTAENFSLFIFHFYLFFVPLLHDRTKVE